MPIVLVLFNRADCLARVVAALRPVRPKRLFLIADAPRRDRPDDVEACRSTRAVIEGIDWPAELTWKIAEANLGPDRSIAEGLDWVFDQVPEAVVLEDDMLPAADFFPWCVAMLARYRSAADISHVGGRNELGVWPCAGADHLLVARGSFWGFATWAVAWREGRKASLAAAGTSPSVALHPDPLVARHLASAHDLVRAGGRLAWDVAWSLASALAGKRAVLPPANLIANIGFGAEATHTGFAGDFRGALPTGAVTLSASGPRPTADFKFDRWSLLVELLAAQRDGSGLSHLAKARHLVRDPRLRLHLAPFDHPAESAAVLRHLKAAGTRSPHLDQLLARMQPLAEKAHGAAGESP